MIHTMVPCDTLTPRALRVTAHAICQWVLVRFELAIFGSQAERSNHYTSVAAYILQCSFIPCVLVVLSITPLAIARGVARGVIDSTPRFFFLSKNPSTSSRVFSRVPSLAYILQCSCIPCVLVVLLTPLAIARGVIDSTPLGFFSLEKPLDFVSCFFSCTVTASSSLFLSMYVAKPLLKT